MAHHTRKLSRRRNRRSAWAIAALAAWPAAEVAAQTAEAASTSTVTISARPLAAAGVGGFGDAPLARSPLQASVFGTSELLDAGVETLGGLTLLDASVSDAYNATGYWAGLSVRGFTLDNRFNYRRDGLPINAETSLPLGNKERIELLKGTSGIQAGTSSPGGLVNLVVKRPTGRLRSAELEWQQPGSVRAAVDLGERFGPDGAVGVRLNASYEHLDPQVRDLEGHRRVFALAADWQAGADTLLEAEVETSRQQQPSLAGFSLLGNAVPDARALDLRVNLNRQPWSGPVEMEGNTASLRWTQRLAQGWRFSAHAMTQRLKSDDRTAFPYGLYDANYGCTWCDRYGPDGTFSYWEYLSLDERRTSDALDLNVAGRATTGPVTHELQAGVLLTRYRGRFQDQVFDLAQSLDGSGVGIGRIDGSATTAPSLGFTDANTNRDERTTEWYLRDVMQLTERWQLWGGLRHTRLERESERTSPDAEGSLRDTAYSQSLTTPWLAAAFQWTPATMLYASWGQGIESDVAPNRSRYQNAGQALPALKSRQAELGIKHEAGNLGWALAAFDIDRPQFTDLGNCDIDDSCLRAVDGSVRHRGVEAQGNWRLGNWLWQGSFMLLDAQREGSSRDGINGLRPFNVPARSVRLNANYQLPAVPGLELQAALAAEGSRTVLPDDETFTIPGWSRLDVGLRWQQSLGSQDVTWRLAVANVLDRRAWQSAPYQFSHAYLYPLEPRTWRASVQTSF